MISMTCPHNRAAREWHLRTQRRSLRLRRSQREYSVQHTVPPVSYLASETPVIERPAAGHELVVYAALHGQVGIHLMRDARRPSWRPGADALTEIIHSAPVAAHLGGCGVPSAARCLIEQGQ